MRTLTVLAVVLICSAHALAGMNPECKVCIDFYGLADSWDDVQSRIDPAPYTTFTAYFCLFQTTGMTTISFRGSVTPGMSTSPVFTNLLPGDLSIGFWEDGITLASIECVDTGFLYFAKLDLFYLGVPGDIMILDDPSYPRWVVDCGQPYGEVDFYCVWMQGGVHKDPVGGDPECVPAVPVEPATWGGIKAMYR